MDSLNNFWINSNNKQFLAINNTGLSILIQNQLNSIWFIANPISSISNTTAYQLDTCQILLKGDEKIWTLII